QNIENSNFDSISKIYWRNNKLDFSSINSLITSLKQFPVHSYLIHKKNAVDELNFRYLIDDENIKKLLTKKEIEENKEVVSSFTDIIKDLKMSRLE
ncbi:hypothetical protein, partial [Desulfobacula sp.]|uniref:hypothetical protein n=1 Tax=Desulfobacula sp. TaxID=2593537 RepID=UPI001E084BAD|nr:hypothetical protein [Desulfobacula sp.]